MLDIIKEWLPSVAVIAGGVWILFNWLIGERRRGKQEIPSIDGRLEAKNAKLDDHKIIVTLEASWRNCGNYPIDIDPASTRIDVYKIEPNTEFGPFQPQKELESRVYQAFPFGDMKSYILEPNTSSVISTHYVLESPNVYLFRWKLYRNQVHGRKIFAWTKELVVACNKNDGNLQHPNVFE